MISRATAFASAMSLTRRPARARRPPTRRSSPARVDRVQAGALVHGLEDVVEEDRMRLAGVAAPQDDQIGVLGLTV